MEGVQCVMGGDDPAKIGRRSEGLCQPSLGQGEEGERRGRGGLSYDIFCFAAAVLSKAVSIFLLMQK